MAISPIGYTPHFTGTAKTDKGNEYQTTNTGKIVGTSAGAVLGGANIWRTSKVYNKVFDKSMDAVKDSLQDAMKEMGEGEASKLINTGKKFGKGFVIASAAIGALLLTGVGFFAGKVFDNKQNEKSAKAADKNAEELIANEQKS